MHRITDKTRRGNSRADPSTRAARSTRGPRTSRLLALVHPPDGVDLRLPVTRQAAPGLRRGGVRDVDDAHAAPDGLAKPVAHQLRRIDPVRQDREARGRVAIRPRRQAELLEAFTELVDAGDIHRR